MTYKNFFDFLRFSLIDGEEVPRDLSPEDWQELYGIGLRQSVLGVMFAGVKKLPKGVAPPNKTLMQWVAMSNEIRRRNIRVNTVAGEIFDALTRDGFRCCVLKGQGNALMYADPYSRAAGDVDIWMCGYKDEGAPEGYVYPDMVKMRRRVMDYVNGHFKVDEVRFHHVCFCYHDVDIEAHFAPSVKEIPKYNRRFLEWCQKEAPRQSEHYVELPENTGRIAIPTVRFNLVYQMQHIFKHFFDMGIGMRQIVDYWHLLMAFEGDARERTKLQEELRHQGLYKFARAVMWVLSETLHLPKEKMVVDVDERRGRLLLAEIINGGNFGKYDTKYGDITHKSMGGKYFTKTYRNLTFVRYYPEEALCEPVFRTLQFLWRKKKGWA